MHKTTVLITLLYLAVLLPCDAAKRGLPEPVIPQCFGVNIHFWNDDEKQVKMIADAGFKLIRMDFLWNEIEKEKGKYDFSHYDGLMTALDRHSIRPLFILNGDNRIYPGGGVPTNEETKKAYAAFAGAGAAHFKDRGIIWEIWNEPNFRFEAEPYAEFAVAAAKAIRQVDPTATVVGPASATIQMDFLDRIFKAGALKGFDAITVHPYRGNCPETAAPQYQWAYNLISRHSPDGKTIPLLCGEWGYSMTWVSAEQQAQNLVRMFLSNLASGVNFSIWYDWWDHSTNQKENEDNFGVVYFDGTPKPSYIAMQALNKQLGGYRLVRRLHSDSPDDYILLFKNRGSYKIAVWTTANPHKIDLPVDVPYVALTDIYGKRKSGSVDGGNLKLQLSQSVTYVEILGKSKRFVIEEAWNVEPGKVVPASAGDVHVRYRLANRLDTRIQAVMTFSGHPGSNVITSRPLNVSAGDIADAGCDLHMAWNGDHPLTALVELKVKGLDKPLYTTVRFDSSKMLYAMAAPPFGDTTTVYVYNPSSEPFTGAVRVEGEQAASAGADVPVKLVKGQTFAEVSCPITPLDPGKCALVVNLLDAGGKTVYASDRFSYKPVTQFDDSSKVTVTLDGNTAVPASTQQATVAPPDNLDGVSSCTRIDYTFGNGWRFARFNCGPLAAIEDKPKYAGIWVYGNESGDGVTVKLSDATGQIFRPTMRKLDFKGWRFVTWPLDPFIADHWGGANDGLIHWPVRWNPQFKLDSTQKEHGGTIYLGPMWLVY